MSVGGRRSWPDGHPSGWAAGPALVSVLAFVSFLACAGGSADERPTATVAMVETPAPSPDGGLPPGDPGVTVENAIQACREKDGDLLRSLVIASVQDEEIQALFDRGTDVRLARRTPARVEDGRATVSVRLEVRRDGELETVDRTWELEQGADGVWRFTTLPDCF